MGRVSGGVAVWVWNLRGVKRGRAADAAAGQELTAYVCMVVPS